MSLKQLELFDLLEWRLPHRSLSQAIVVEFLEGGSLQELLQSKAEIDLHMALKIALHAAAGTPHLPPTHSL
jgi:hypothetical protein